MLNVIAPAMPSLPAGHSGTLFRYASRSPLFPRGRNAGRGTACRRQHRLYYHPASYRDTSLRAHLAYAWLTWWRFLSTRRSPGGAAPHHSCRRLPFAWWRCASAGHASRRQRMPTRATLPALERAVCLQPGSRVFPDEPGWREEGNDVKADAFEPPAVNRFRPYSSFRTRHSLAASTSWFRRGSVVPARADEHAAHARGARTRSCARVGSAHLPLPYRTLPRCLPSPACASEPRQMVLNVSFGAAWKGCGARLANTWHLGDGTSLYQPSPVDTNYRLASVQPIAFAGRADTFGLSGRTSPPPPHIPTLAMQRWQTASRCTAGVFAAVLVAPAACLKRGAAGWRWGRHSP